MPGLAERLEVEDSVASTSTALRERAEAGGAEAALLARRQPGGRGQMGRVWESVPGNLHLSALLHRRPGGLPGHWALLAGVAAVEALRPIVPAVRLKWPNDLLLGGAKLGGMLVELGEGPPRWAVLGFGINLAGAPALDRALTSVAAHAAAPEVVGFAGLLLRSVDRWRERYEAEGFGPVREAWLRYGHLVGEEVATSTGERGGFAGLAEDGGMMLDGGAGRVTIRRV